MPPDTSGGAVDPPQGSGRRELTAIDLPPRRSTSTSGMSARTSASVAACRKVWAGKLAAQILDVRRRDVPDGERTVDRDEDLHARYSPLLPPRFFDQPDFADDHRLVDGLDHVVDRQRGHADGGERLHLDAGLRRSSAPAPRSRSRRERRQRDVGVR